MQFLALSDDDWRLFEDWAEAEGWKLPFQEQRLFQGQWRPSFFVLKHAGWCCGFVSAVAYKRSGWIGNLLVDPQQRGKGYGSALFDFALSFLHRAQPERVWLTASSQGAPLYRKHGFISVDRVERWVVRGLGGQAPSCCNQLNQLIDLDCRCWKESRAPLLSLLADDAVVIRQGETMALLQKGTDFWQLGPWLSPGSCPREKRLLLTRALQSTPADKPLIVDALSSTGSELILRNAGFNCQESNELMCRCQHPAQINGVMALASLGSIG